MGESEVGVTNRQDFARDQDDMHKNQNIQQDVPA